MPFVAGTVASHSNPKEVPNNTADKFEAGRRFYQSHIKVKF